MFAGDLRVTVQRRRRQPVLFLNMRHYSLPSTMMTSQTLQRCRSPSTVAAPACTIHAHELLDPIMAVVWCVIFFCTWQKSTVKFLPKNDVVFGSLIHIHLGNIWGSITDWSSWIYQRRSLFFDTHDPCSFFSYYILLLLCTKYCILHTIYIPHTFYIEIHIYTT